MKQVRVATTAEMDDLRRFVGDRAPTVEEAIAAARFLICISAPCREARIRAELDARGGLTWLEDAGVKVPEFPGSGYGVAERIREWFERAYPEAPSAEGEVPCGSE